MTLECINPKDLPTFVLTQHEKSRFAGCKEDSWHRRSLKLLLSRSVAYFSATVAARSACSRHQRRPDSFANSN